MSTKEVRQQRRTVRVLPLAVKHWREDHLHWSQETAARMASRTEAAKHHGVTVSPSMIAMIESDKRQPSLAVAEAIAEAFDIPLGAFGERLAAPTGQVA